MSLVALLAGEHHGDRPVTACPVIAAYAIKVNDAADCATRQRLKPFAPGIVGTRDGRTRERAWLLVRACINETVPRMLADAGADRDLIAHLPSLPWRPGAGYDLGGFADRFVAVGRAGGLSRGRIADIRYLFRACARNCPELVASAAAVLLIDAAHAARGPRRARWYWNLALDLIDRLCAVGIGDRPASTARAPAYLSRQMDAESDRTLSHLSHLARRGPAMHGAALKPAGRIPI